MGGAEADEGLPAISICPRCGARLVTRNLWALVWDLHHRRLVSQFRSSRN